MSTASTNTLDVSSLPSEAWDEASPLWWGNLLLIFIETTTIALLIAIYFYLRMNFGEWPPPKVDVFPVLYHPVPDLGAATINTILLAASCALMYWTDLRARALDKPRTLIGLVSMFAISIVNLICVRYELFASKFWWNDNAYASIVWVILIMQGIYILAGTLEFALMGTWIFTHELDEKHGLDVTLAGGYWYWVAATGVVLYFVVFWSPRWIGGAA
jgi:heme/copper-type cytochrome/quinol oxidase subunit 3